MIKHAKHTRFLGKFTSTIEKVIVTILIFMMSLILISATLQLAYSLFMDFYTNKSLLISLNALMSTFGGFLLILIGIELLETIKVYLKQNIVHVEVVILVAIIALARKIVILNIEDLSIEVSAGIAFLILALGIAYYLIKKTGIMILSLNENSEDEMSEQKK
jgi:uncharacterized membrane protein (DUF373 family)